MDAREMEIAPADLKARIEAGTPPTLVDVRWAQEWAINRLPGAVHVPLDRITELAEEMDPGEDVVFYCHHGIRSLDAAMFLRSQGFTKARSLKGGIDLWAMAIDPSVPRY